MSATYATLVLDGDVSLFPVGRFDERGIHAAVIVNGSQIHGNGDEGLASLELLADTIRAAVAKARQARQDADLAHVGRVVAVPVDEAIFLASGETAGWRWECTCGHTGAALHVHTSGAQADLDQHYQLAAVSS